MNLSAPWNQNVPFNVEAPFNQQAKCYLVSTGTLLRCISISVSSK